MIKRIIILIVAMFLAAHSYADLAYETTQAKKDYLKKVSERFKSQWRILKAKEGWTCEVYILQDRDGNVLKSNVSKCNTDNKIFISQTEKAIKRASPFPRAPDAVFTSELVLHPKIKKDVDFMRSLKKDRREGDATAIKLSKAFRDSIEKGAKESSPMAMRILKVITQYKEGWKAFKSGDNKTAFDKWLPLAEDNHKSSQFNLGVMYSLGKGVTKDLSKSFYWYNRAAKLGHTPSQYGVAWMYHNGVGVEKDISKALEWYKEAALYEDEAAMFTLGAMYYNESSGPEDKAKARNLIQRSADKGYSKAVKFLDKYK